MALARRADDVDDNAAFARRHAGVILAREVDKAPHFQVPRFTPGFFVETDHRALRNRAGVVHQKIDVADITCELFCSAFGAEIAGVAGHIDLVGVGNFFPGGIEIGCSA